jgi:hypothetical protein
LQPTTIELSVLARTAAAGLSSISMTCWPARSAGQALLCMFLQFGGEHVGLADQRNRHAIDARSLDGPGHDCSGA